MQKNAVSKLFYKKRENLYKKDVGFHEKWYEKAFYPRMSWKKYIKSYLMFFIKIKKRRRQPVRCIFNFYSLNS